MSKIRKIVLEFTPYQIGDNNYELRLKIDRFGKETVNSIKILQEDQFFSLYDRIMEQVTYELRKHIEQESSKLQCELKSENSV